MDYDHTQRHEQLYRTKQYLAGIYDPPRRQKSEDVNPSQKTVDEKDTQVSTLPELRGDKIMTTTHSEKSLNKKILNHSSTEIVYDMSMTNVMMMMEMNQMQTPNKQPDLNTVNTMSMSSHIPTKKSTETSTDTLRSNAVNGNEAGTEITHTKQPSATIVSSTCKTASGLPQFVNRLTPYHEEQQVAYHM